MKTFEELKEEAIKRGVWNNPDTTTFDEAKRNFGFFEIYDSKKDTLFDSYGVVSKNGIWIEPIKSKTENIEVDYTEVGYKENQSKLTYELDFDFITQVAERMSKNKGKYTPYNWKKPINIEDLKQSLFRHVLEVMKGNYQDGEESLGHITAVAINAMLINYQLKNNQQ